MYSERFFRSGTLRIHFRDWGDPGAPPLIMVHGLRDHSHSFDDLARGLLGGEVVAHYAGRASRSAGHMVHFDRPRELVTAIRHFLLA